MHIGKTQCIPLLVPIKVIDPYWNVECWIKIPAIHCRHQRDYSRNDANSLPQTLSDTKYSKFVHSLSEKYKPTYISIAVRKVLKLQFHSNFSCGFFTFPPL